MTLILTLRPIYLRGISFPVTIVGVIAAILLGAGLIPPYFEIFRRRGKVVGISFIFLSLDWFGAFFSLMALVAQRSFDVLGGTVYITCLVLECGIFVSHLMWWLCTYQGRKAAQARGEEYDNKEKLAKPRKKRAMWRGSTKGDTESGTTQTTLGEEMVNMAAPTSSTTGATAETRDPVTTRQE